MGKVVGMSLADRRRALGYSQEGLAHEVGVDRRTVGRWERGHTVIQPPLRPVLAEVLHVTLADLDRLLPATQALPEKYAGVPAGERDSPGADDMLRREFLRAITVAGTFAALDAEQADALAESVHRGSPEDALRMNEHLWRVYRLAPSKRSVQPLVTDQLAVLSRSVRRHSAAEAASLCEAAGNLFQLAGELAFDDNRLSDAVASYSLAASASKEAGSFDLWACALVRHAYVEMGTLRYAEAAELLEAAQRVARRGDSTLPTRCWVAAVQAQAHAGLGDMAACEQALALAETVIDLNPTDSPGGWIRFDGSRLAEERGSRYVQLGRLDLAESTLLDALRQATLAEGQSYRRRGAVLTDLAAIGAAHQDVDRVTAYGEEAVRLARESSSGYVATRLRSLQGTLGALAKNSRVADLRSQIVALKDT